MCTRLRLYEYKIQSLQLTLRRCPPCSGLGSEGSHETVRPSLRSQHVPSEGRVPRQRRDGGRRWEQGQKSCRRFENCHCKIWGNRSGFQAGRPPAEEERRRGKESLRNTRRRPRPALADVTFIFEKGKRSSRRRLYAFPHTSVHRGCAKHSGREHTRVHIRGCNVVLVPKNLPRWPRNTKRSDSFKPRAA